MNYLLFAETESRDILEEQQAITALARQVINNLWEILFSDNKIFGSLVYPLIFIAVIALFYTTIKLLKEYFTSHESYPDLSALLWPIVLCLFLINNGDLARRAGLLFRDFAFALDQSVLIQFKDTLKIDQAQNDALTESEILDKIQEKMDDCVTANSQKVAGGTSAKEVCYNTLREEVAAVLKNEKIQNPIIRSRLEDIANILAEESGNLAKIDEAISDNPVTDWIGDQLVSVVRLILQVLGFGYQIILEFCLIIALLVLPFPLVISLVNLQGLIAWFSAYWTLVNAKLSFTIIVSLIAFFQAKQNGTSQLFLAEILTGVFSPILSGLVGMGGGIAAYQTFSAGLALVAGASFRGVAGAGRSAMGAVGKASAPIASRVIRKTGKKVANTKVGRATGKAGASAWNKVRTSKVGKKMGKVSKFLFKD
jgi:hypothetical protein